MKTGALSAVHQSTYEVIPKIMPEEAISEIIGEPREKNRKAVQQHFTSTSTELEKSHYDRNNETGPHFTYSTQLLNNQRK